MNQLNSLDNIITKCTQKQILTNQEIKNMFILLSKQTKQISKNIQNHSTTITNINTNTQQTNIKITKYKEQYEHYKTSITDFQKNINNTYLQTRKIILTQVQKVKNDMKLLLSQFQVQYGMWDQMYFLFLSRFQKQINQEFFKVYQLINQKKNCEEKPKINPQNFEFIETAQLFLAQRTMQVYQKEKQNEQKIKLSSNRLKPFQNIQKITRKHQKRQLKSSQNSKMLKQQFKYSKNWIHPQCYHLINIILHDNQITATNNLPNVFLFGSIVLNHQFTFYMRFDTINQNVSLGIGNIEYVSLSKIGESSPNIIQYTNDAYLYADGKYAKKEGQGFKVREKIAVSGNLKLRYIKFSVENQVRCSYEWQKNMYKNVKWVPYLVLDNQDAVSIFE